MIEELEITVPDLLKIVRKGDDMTLAEQKDLQSQLEILARNCYSIWKDGKEVYMTDDQRRFARVILPGAIRHDVPKLVEMMQVFGLDMSTVFYYQSGPYEPAW